MFGLLNRSIPDNSFKISNPTCDCEPLADFTYAQQTSSLTLDFDAGLSAGTEPLQYAWDYGDGSSGSGKTSAHSYAEGGDYLVKLTVTDPCDGSAAAEKWITVMEAGGSLLEVDIEGPTVALKNQEVAFHALAGSGVPPYTFCWSAGGGDPQPLPGPGYLCGPYEENQTIAFHQPTGLGTATVSVVVTDAAGQQADDLLYIDIRDADLDLDFNHFPATPTGLTANDALAVGQYLAWAAVVTPLSEWEPPLEYTWDFGDGTVITEPNGQTEHSFMDDNVYTVSLKMCNPVYGTCMTKTKTYYVGNPLPPSDDYKITPEQTVELTWGGATKTIALTKTNGAFCAPNSNSGCGPTIAWASVGWPDCGYTAQTSSSIVGPSFQINVDGSDPCVSSWEFADPTNIHPWGCLEVAAQDANCGGAYHPCAVYLRPAALQAQNLRIEEEAGCQFRLAADVAGGGWKNGAVPTAPYREYRWEVFDFENSKIPIEGLLDDPAAKNPVVQLQHPYIERTPARQHVLFVAKLTVVDWANQMAEAYQVLSFNPFRLLVEEAYQRCPETRSYFTEDDALVSGGTGIYEYSWTVLQPAGSALDFELGDAHDPFPFFQAPASGSKVYRLNVKMKDASGAVPIGTIVDVICCVGKYTYKVARNSIETIPLR